MKKPLYYILIGVFSLIFLFSAWKIAKAVLNYYNSDRSYRQAREQYKTEVTTEDPKEKQTGDLREEEESESLPAYLLKDYSSHEHEEKLSLLYVDFDYILMPQYEFDFTALQAVNPEVKAWIRIDGTNIDYPVVQGTDNSKYLRTGADGKALNAGAIFIDYRNGAPFEDPVTIIYGHNQRNHAIFHDLLSYQEESFFSQHPFVEIYLPDGSAMKYQVYAAGIIPALGSNYQMEFADDSELQAFFDRTVDNSSLNHQAELTVDDRIIYLSTCTDEYDDSRRMVVAARLISTN